VALEVAVLVVDAVEAQVAVAVVAAQAAVAADVGVDVVVENQK